MWGWDLPSRWRARFWLLALALGLGAAGGGVEAKVFHSRSEALEVAFPDADRVERKSFVLDEAQARSAEELARARLDSRLVTLYTGWKGGELLGYAFIDIHTVRTLPEAFIVILTPEGRVRSIRMLAFHEPQEYLPGQRWLDQFDRKALDDRLRIGGEIHGIAGSTLSARAVTGGVRRALAFYQVLVGNGNGPLLPHPPAGGAGGE